MLADSQRCLLVAEWADHPEAGHPGSGLAGAVDVRIYHTPDDRMLVQTRRGHVEELVVDRASRRRGVGRALMEAAADWCRRRGATQLLLTVWGGNDEASRFYDDLGYGEVNRVLGREL